MHPPLSPPVKGGEIDVTSREGKFKVRIFRVLPPWRVLPVHLA